MIKNNNNNNCMCPQRKEMSRQQKSKQIIIMVVMMIMRIKLKGFTAKFKKKLQKSKSHHILKERKIFERILGATQWNIDTMRNGSKEKNNE